MAKDLIESRIFSKDDLSWFESTLKKQIEETDAQLSKLRATLAKIQQLRLVSDNGAGGDTDEVLLKIRGILMQAGEPLAKREIKARYDEIEDREIPISVIENCLYEYRGKYFEVVGERAAAKWRLIE